jgi:hypothetical protein
MLVGHVTWQGRPPQPSTLQQLPITLTIKSGSSETNYPVQLTDSSGHWSAVISNIPPGPAVWRVKGPQFLANSGDFTVTSGPPYVINVEMGTMRTGDCFEDNVVSVRDVARMRNTYGKSQGDPGYDGRADFNGDNLVDITDFNLLKSNFGSGGAPSVRPTGSK